MTQPLTNAQKAIRYREKLRAARASAGQLAVRRAALAIKAPPSRLSLQDLRAAPRDERQSASGIPFYVNRSGISLPFVRGYCDG